MDDTSRLVYPSTLRYKDRKELAEKDSYSYTKLYSATSNHDVWNRLTSDASVRQSLSPPSFREGGTATGRMKNSGFESNTMSPPTTYTHYTFKSGYLEEEAPLHQYPALTLQRFKKKHLVDFYIAARPQCETTNQTFRMLGTYDADKNVADLAKINIPHMSPGGKDSYHPDVTHASYGLRPTLPRAAIGQTLADGKNLK